MAAPDALDDDPVLIDNQENKDNNVDNTIDQSPEDIIIRKYDSTETVTFTPKHKTSMNGGSGSAAASLTEYQDDPDPDPDHDQPSMYTSLMPPAKYSTYASPQDRDRSAYGSFARSTRGEILSTDLDNRLERLSRWIMSYFIFAIAEMIYNAVATENTQSINNLKTTPYQIWLSSDIFLFLGCIVGWFSLHHIHDLAHNAKEYYDQYLKYAAGALFILCGFLQWIAVIEQNHFNYCHILAGIDSSYVHKKISEFAVFLCFCISDEIVTVYFIR